MNNYSVMQEIKKPWIQISILFIVLHIIDFLIINSTNKGVLNSVSIFYIPVGIMLFVFFLVLFYPKYLKDKEQITENNLRTYRKICASAFVLLNFVYLGIMLYQTSSLNVEPLNLAVLCVAVTQLIVGISFTKLTPNSYVGLKFPWLIKNEKAWKITHRISAYIWIFFGITGLTLSLSVTVNVALVFIMMLPIVISFLISILMVRKYPFNLVNK